MGLLRWIGNQVLGLVGLVLPMLGRAAGGLWTRTAFWVAHAVIVAAILVGLWFLNGYLDVPRYLRAPTAWLAAVWLPALFGLLYLNLWLGFWVWALLRPGAAESPFPDIDAGWADVLTALDRAGLDLARVPLFLVLGRPRGGDEALFRASGLTLNPMGGGGVVRAFAGPNGVFVLAPDCCLTGGLADWAAKLVGAEGAEGAEGDAVGAAGSAALLPGVPSLLAAPPPAVPDVVAPEPDVPPLTRNPAELDRLAARFRHLCGRIVQTRRPYCPVNGVLALIPEAATRSPGAAGLAALLVGRDLKLAAEALEVRCPVVGVVCDTEQVSGFRELVRRLPVEKRGQRFGRRLPYAPRLAPADRAGLIAEAVRWTCQELVPRLTYRVLPADPADPASEDLVLLAAALYRRQETLARLFAAAFGSDDVGPVWAGGCYLAGTGAGPDSAGFLTDVFAQLVEGQNLVAWTPAGRSADAALSRRTAVGYGVAVLVVTAAVGLGVATAVR